MGAACSACDSMVDAAGLKKRRSSVHYAPTLLQNADSRSSMMQPKKSTLSELAVQQRCCKVLVTLAEGSTEDAMHVANTGGADVAVRAMSASPGDACLQKTGCQLLRTLASVPQRESEEAAIATLGAVQTVLLAMASHPADAGVQEQGCAALSALVLQRNPSSRDNLASRGGLHAVVEAMEHHAASHAVQEEACYALGVLAPNANKAECNIIQHGLKAVVRAMGDFTHMVSLQARACYALGCVMRGHPDHQAEFVRLHGPEVLLRTMRSHMASTSVQEVACQATHVLASGNHRNAELLVSLGYFDALLTVLCSHSKVTEVSAEASVVLHDLVVSCPKRCLQAAAPEGASRLQNSLSAPNLADHVRDTMQELLAILDYKRAVPR